MPAGEYIVNVHMYRGVGVAYPVDVKLVATAKADPQQDAQELATTTVQLRHENDQVTAFRFNLDDDGHLVAGSLNTLYKDLRTASQ
jgi:hypothetical protein